MNPIVFAAYFFAIWLVTFLFSLFPTRWVGNWIARHNLPMPLGIIACMKVAILFVTCVSLFLIWMRFDFVPHSDNKDFVYFFTTINFGIPVYAALILGYIRDRCNEHCGF